MWRVISPIMTWFLIHTVPLQALLVEQSTVTTVDIRTKLTEAEHLLNETKRSRTEVQVCLRSSSVPNYTR